MADPSDTPTALDRRQAMTLAGATILASALFAAPVSIGAAIAGPATRASLTQVRNATLRIDYGGVRFLVDPVLADKDAYPGFEGTANSQRRNPLVPLPMPLASIIDVDAVIVTHLHPDHWDEAAKAKLNKARPIFVQNAGDAAQLHASGFADVRILTENTAFRGVRLSRTGGQHGTDAALKALPQILGPVSGFVLRHPSHKTLYVAGDTIWNREVERTIATYAPDVIVLNAGMATVIGLDPIIMGPTDVLAVHRAAPNAMLIASHMEAVNHCILSRADLRAFAKQSGYSQRLLIPADGETLVI
ncbi:L-ascorbate metabolism protein UlaG, beta-lactamase superfamily [Sphingomonas sp. NFR04]|uniref:MBL fold metallo-hydrolase n=1 Tax=Sphingomonas sp. NFR04 TaxID=1566283 RepID=UPI0008E74523|nr:MBL fold metallo-hydrolase [Sphingomonas sp. NFR04]SFK48083.1 L-ascorbate metabolism protein UlaG, beta-lactamase superfamily [Sphingomonas sp. NFR04]